MPNNPGNPGTSNDPEQLPGVMCARVYNGSGTFQRSFCATGQLGMACRGAPTLTCGDDNTGTSPATGPRAIWYQKAIDWAKQSGHPKVVLDPGIITITNTTKIPWGWPWPQGVGIHVPPGIHLEGSQAYDTAPTVINVAHASTDLESLIMVADPLSDLSLPAQLADASVSYLTLVGTTNSGYDRGQACPSTGHSLNSILDLDGHEPTLANATWPFMHGKRLITTGVHVAHSNVTNGAPVSLHHLKIAHVGGGIAYGWNTIYNKETPSCQTRPGLKLTVTPKTGAPCPTGTVERRLLLSAGASSCRPNVCNADGSIPAGDCSAISPYPAGLNQLPDGSYPLVPYCIGVVPTTEWGAPLYCASKPYEIPGNPDARSQVHHNSICDVKVAVNIVGGNVDVTKNVAIRHATDRANFFGMSTDGHLPYSQSTTYSENFVSGFQLGFLTDGSQYTYVDDCTFRRLTGYHPSEFADFQNVLDLRQFMFDDAQPFFAQTEPLRGFIDHVYIRDNRFYKNQMGISLYRVNWGFVGFNTIDSAGAVGSGDIGVLTSNTINSWIYGNTIRDFGHAIDIAGSPGQQSTLGSCYNGIHTYCSDYGCPLWGSYPNSFSGSGSLGGTTCNVAYHKGYCADAASTPSPTFPAGVETQCFAY
ncbi:hypothetical protein OV208_39530 [Corallococcus sp. bb12-1]|uniref:NosD domain-containing protein n=1 Tax=Corallococcus sp. bb12-1 TaxID=2996784 RepID=UPI00226DE56F|nr:NosD domain-containing protein [Corallococcus sp. bb12-1]MCY1047457.1 hypothetical protein [Corallococcus sp. bb12-1]